MGKKEEGGRRLTIQALGCRAEVEPWIGVGAEALCGNHPCKVE